MTKQETHDINIPTLNFQQAELLGQLVKEINQLSNASFTYEYSRPMFEEDPKTFDKTILAIDLHNNSIPTDENCVASIDLMEDQRYHNNATFNVDIYNEDIYYNQPKRLKLAYQLQKLAIKYAHKMIKAQQIN